MVREPSDSDRPGERQAAAERSHRALSGPLLSFDLAKEADRLRAESPWTQHGRNAVTLVKHPDLRIVYMLMKPSTRMQEHHSGATVSVHALSGHVRLHLGEQTFDLPAGHVLVLERDIPHDVEAIAESAVLITIAWRGE